MKGLDMAVALLPTSLKSSKGSLATVTLLREVFTEDDFNGDIFKREDIATHRKVSSETLESLEQKLGLFQGIIN
jgi:hypothetical protein